MVFLGVGTLWLSLLGSSASLFTVAGALALVGLWTGTFISPNTSALLGAAPPNRRGIASGILAEARNVGMVLGVGLAGAVFNSVLQGGKPGPDPLTFKALSASFTVAALVAFIGAITAVAAGAPRPTEPA
jgi:sugar phosphate permease